MPQDPIVLLALVLLAVHVSLPLAMWLLQRQRPSRVATLWYLGGFAYAAAVMVSITRGLAPGWISFVIRVGLAALALLLFVEALRGELRRPAWSFKAYAAALGAWVFAYATTYIGGQHLSWGSVMWALVSIGLLGYLLLLLRELKERAGSTALGIVASGAGLLIVTQAARHLFAFMTEDYAGAMPLDGAQGRLVILGFVIGVILLFTGMLGYLLEKARTREADARLLAQQAELEVLRRNEMLLAGARLATAGAVSVYTTGLLKEVAQPVQALHGGLQSLRDRSQAQQAPAQVLSGIDHLLAQAAAAGAQLDDLRARVGALHTPPEPVDLRAAVLPLLAVIAAEARRRGAQFSHELPGASDPAAWALCDARMLQRLLFNLAANALDQLQASPFPHHLNLSIRGVDSPEGARVCVRMCDSGPGASAAARAQVGRPFEAITPDGTGLALLLADDLCRQWGARLRLAPLEDPREPWPGHCIEMHLLPATPPPAQSAPAETDATGAAQSPAAAANT